MNTPQLGDTTLIEKEGDKEDLVNNDNKIHLNIYEKPTHLVG